MKEGKLNELPKLTGDLQEITALCTCAAHVLEAAKKGHKISVSVNTKHALIHIMSTDKSPEENPDD